MNRRRVLVVALAALFLLASQVQTASAAYIDNRVGNPNYNPPCFDGTQANPRYVCRTDSDDVYWWAENEIDRTTSPNDTGAETSINATMTESYDTTDLAVRYDTNPSFSGSNETDIVYRSEAGGFVTSDDGYTWCDDGTTANVCDQQYVNFRYRSTGQPLACHETGSSELRV